MYKYKQRYQPQIGYLLFQLWTRYKAENLCRVICSDCLRYFKMSVFINRNVFGACFAFTILVLCETFHVREVSSNQRELFELSIIHINDFHAHFEQTDPSSGTCLEGQEASCVGGIARIATTVKKLVKERPNAVFLNAGDNFQGTLWYTKFKWNVTAYFLNMLPHDALVTILLVLL